MTAMPNYWHVAEETRTNKRNLLKLRLLRVYFEMGITSFGHLFLENSNVLFLRGGGRRGGWGLHFGIPF